MFVCPECGASQASPGNCPADGTALQPVGDDFLLGQTIGAYRVARLMGIGGMGRVYKAVHPTIGSRVAIKVLSRECTDRRDLVDRFFAEAKAVNVIRHESIVNVLDLATLPDGRPYIVMEYLDGSSLAAIIASASRSGMPLPIGGVARLCVEVLDALGAAHAKGIIHRDLKPDNIYVTPAGRAKVLDFGIAKLQPELGGSGASTHTGSLLGTPHYMSPEQASAQPVDARADLYAIGVILFECLTLQRPFVAPSLFDLLRMHLEAPPPSIRAIRRDVPEGVEHVIMAALAKRPEERFGNAQAMSVALQHATAQLPGDQWAPIQPAFASRQSQPQAWAPTPPASWAGSGAPHAHSHTPSTAGEVSRMPPQAPMPHAVSGGGSRKGLWLALAGVVLVGGGVTAGVLATRGGSKQAAPPGPGSQVAVTGSDAGLAVVPVENPPVPTPIPTGRDPWSDDLPPEAAAQMDKVIGDLIDEMPAAQRNALPPELLAALAKYGAWSKIPDAERKPLLAKLTGGGGLGGALGGAGLDMNDLDILGDAFEEPALPKSPKAADGWVQASQLQPPQPTSAGKVDTARFMTWATGQAKKLFPDATLVRFDVMGALADGTTRLADVDNGMLAFRFIVPSRAKPDPNRPPGAKADVLRCAFQIVVTTTNTLLVPADSDCRDRPLGTPKCSVAKIWKRAIDKKAPANGIATLSYFDDAGTTVWIFSLRDEAKGINIGERFLDDC